MCSQGILLLIGLKILIIMTLLQNIILSAQDLLMLMGSKGDSTDSYCYYPTCAL